jgi:hypothetical protein
MAALPAKSCASCGRSFQWRKKWERNWDAVRFCSERCRRRKLTPSDRALEIAIVDLLAERRRGATICPSDAAKAVGGLDENMWRPLMEPARAAARRLVARDKVVITQGGTAVNPSTAKGPIRIRAL